MAEQPNLPDLEDVQGNILTRYKAGVAAYLFYRVDLAERARQWVGALITRVTTEKEYVKEKDSPRSMLNIALTYQGLKALGLSPTSLNSFPVEFREGMKKRAATLCDFGESAPQNWEAPLGSPQIHILVLVHGIDKRNCKDLVDWANQQIPKAGEGPVGVTLLARMDAEGLEGDKEHFGFRDGISQPWIEGTHPGPPTQPYGGKRVKPNGYEPTPENSFAPLRRGEFLLGHKDELDRVPQSLVPPVLGVNGTYLIFRKLYQDVAQFRSEMAKQAEYVFGDKAFKDRLAALTVGRWPSGCPVDRSPAKDDLQYATEQAINAFYFDDDPNGTRCPVSSHIRRINARDLRLDAKGNLIVEPMSTRHRMIRRSLPYGPPLEKDNDDKKKTDRGLMFVALVADIERQFEFVQRSWINDGDPFRLDSSDRDPLCGNNRDGRDRPPADQPSQPHAETKRKFSVPAATRLPWALNLPEFVKTRGGEYFFLPSLTALRGVAGLGFSSFRHEYAEAAKTNPDPAERSRVQSDLISNWLILRPKEMLDELRRMAEEEGKIFQMEGYTVFGKPDYTTSPPIAIVTKYQDVLEVLDWKRHPGFSVKLYRNQMEVLPPRPSRGQFILGKELNDPLYEREMPVLASAVQNSKVWQSASKILADIMDSIFTEIQQRKDGKLDIIQDLAWPIPLAINAKYFGVPGPDLEAFKRWLRNIYRDLFLNLRRNSEWSKLADIAVSEMNPYLDGLIQQYDMRVESVLKELILANQNANPRFEPDFVRRNIMGLTVAVVETSLKAIARTIDQFLRRPQQLKEAQEAAARDDKEAVLKYAYEAMRFNPQNHVLFRLCVKDTSIAAGTSREAIVRQGTIVFVATLPAMFDEDGPFQRPNEFRTDRDLKDYLFFGHDGHECMGRYLMRMVFQELFVRLLKLKDIRRALDDPFDPLDLFPEHFCLEFTP